MSRIEIVFAYPGTSITGAQAQNVTLAYAKALHEIVEQSVNKIGQIDLVGPAHLAKIWTWNREMPQPIYKCVHDLIESNAKLRPDALAVVAEDGEFTYGELSERSTRLAHCLVELGVGPEDVVPLSFEKSKWAILAMLSVIKAGAAIVNLDVQQPKARLDGLIQKLKATLILTSRKHEKIWEDRMKVLVIDQGNISRLPHYSEPPFTKCKPNNALYVIFTSGSMSLLSSTGSKKYILQRD